MIDLLLLGMVATALLAFWALVAFVIWGRGDARH